LCTLSEIQEKECLRIKLNNLWTKKFNLGICGDWISGSKAEDAWLSAQKLFYRIKKNPPRRRV